MSHVKRSKGSKKSKSSKSSNRSSKSSNRSSKRVKIPTEKGWMEKYGYVHIKELSKQDRQTKLKKILKDVPALSVYRRLIAISIKLKTNSPENSKLFRQDAEWIKTQSEYKNRSVAKQKPSATKAPKGSKKSKSSKKSRK